ncbi:MAG: phosphonopyruvate decarboxylase [Eubacteriales bacterium]|nr:phosphonopyruvate decarboxylase [Eubacteriales bacterium]
MLDQIKLIQTLHDAGVDFFTGVPDSYLNGFCNSLLVTVPSEHNVIAANEGNAVAIAAGYYFSTGKVPLVYMQNSGVGNTINPLVSLADKDVYRVPMLLFIGWRGEPGTGDHAQHKRQGEITPKLPELLGIPCHIAPDDNEAMSQLISEALATVKAGRTPVAILVPKGVMAEEKKSTAPVENGYPLFREEAMEAVLDALPENAVCSATTGRATRELYFLRERRGEGHGLDFLNVGSMGHASSVAFSIAMNRKDRYSVCFDGDSAALMHMGAMSMVSKYDLPNFMHIILNNGAHESVGGQPSAGFAVDFIKIAQGCGYKTPVSFVTTREEVMKAVRELVACGHPTFIEIRVKKGLAGKLPPLNIDSHELLINELMNELQK